MLRIRCHVQHHAGAILAHRMNIVMLLLMCVACSPAKEPNDESNSATSAPINVTEPMVNNEDKNEDSKLSVQTDESGKLTVDLAQRLRDGLPSDRVAVIVEVITSRPIVQFEPRKRDSGTTLRPKSVIVDAESTNAEGFDKAVAYFEAVCWSGNAPVYIKAASAISIDVNFSELKEILKQPFVQKVSLNERHKP